VAEKRKILLLSGLQVFPAESGGQLRTGSLVGALAAKGFDVRLYSMVGRKKDYQAGVPSGTTEVAPGIQEYVDRGKFWAALQLIAYRRELPPFWITLVLRLYKPGRLRELLAWADAVIVDFPFLYPAVRGTAKPAILNTHNVEADLWKKPWVKRWVARIERAAAAALRRVVCCSTGDQAFFAKLVGPEQTCVVPNGIDMRRFDGIAAHRAALRASLGYRDADRVMLFAASSFGPNVEALEWLKGFVQEHKAMLETRNLHFLVAGSVSKTPYTLPRLTVVGMVPKIEPYFAAADLAFNGVFRGSGTNVKMGEFMAAGLPIITSDVGTRGFDVVDGEDVVVFTLATLAAVLGAATVLDDRSRLARMARSAFEKNKRGIDMRCCVEPLAEWLSQC
jgi:glycosyltransferase involved in cell wall biosynthesis